MIHSCHNSGSSTAERARKKKKKKKEGEEERERKTANLNKDSNLSIRVEKRNKGEERWEETGEQFITGGTDKKDVRSEKK